MNRKEFIKKSLLGAAAIGIAPKVLNTKENKTNNKDIGFNHIPLKEEKTMNTVLHRSNTRGVANHGWLNSHHSFSFANYYNPERMNFGALRVLNDDRVAAGQGFGKHPHDNMEIISIPLEGDLEHKDSMGNTTVIKEGDIQVMSAGTGVFHSEYNKNQDREVKFLQIWVVPNTRNVTPRYDQIPLSSIKIDNDFYQVLSPNSDDQGVWINQDAWFNLGELKEGATKTYTINKPGNGLYVFLLDGSLEIAGNKLESRDGFGVWNTDSVDINITKDSKVLLMEVPMLG
ncbi:pirin family protein [Candidatus Kapabacteria bacterium]|nr:pirin family protein [Candidatus Kapabacteria bacterium]